MNTPISVYVFAEKGKYDYFYHPKLVGEDEVEHSLLDDLEYCLLHIIDMFGIKINFHNKILEIGEKYDFEDEKLIIQLTDTYGVYSKGFGSQSQVHIFKLTDKNWVSTDHAFEFRLVPPPKAA